MILIMYIRSSYQNKPYHAYCAQSALFDDRNGGINIKKYKSIEDKIYFIYE